MWISGEKVVVSSTLTIPLSSFLIGMVIANARVVPTHLAWFVLLQDSCQKKVCQNQRKSLTSAPDYGLIYMWLRGERPCVVAASSPRWLGERFETLVVSCPCCRRFARCGRSQSRVRSLHRSHYSCRSGQIMSAFIENSA